MLFIRSAFNTKAKESRAVLQQKSYVPAFTLLVCLLLGAAMLGVCLGALKISFPQLGSIILNSFGLHVPVNYQPQQVAVLINIRLPRVLLAVLLGAGLSASGAAMQALFRNPLADPSLIGISSGSLLFAVAFIVLNTMFLSAFPWMLNTYSLSFMAFAGAGLSAWLIYSISVTNGKAVVSTMLLAGIAITALSRAIVGLITTMATDQQLRNITFWDLGSLGGASWQTVTGVAPFILIPVLFLPRLAKSLNLLALGESQAGFLGVNTSNLKRNVIVLATMAVGASVAVAGMIAFMGLAMPHVVRLLIGADNRRLIPAAAIAGAATLTLADTLARTLVAPAELPIGILTALIGTPVFLWILLSNKRKAIAE